MKKRKVHPVTPEYHTLLKGYHRHLGILGYNDTGRTIKYAHVAEFLRRVEKQGVTAIEAVTPVMIQAHYQYLKNRPHKKTEGTLSPKTVAMHMRSLRVFFAFLQESGRIIAGPMSTLTFRYPKPSGNTHRTVITVEEIRELYRSAETLQERVILSLGYGCALRAMELARVNLEDIKSDDGILIVPRGKGNKRRVVPMSGQVQQDIQNYIENERDLYLMGDYQRALILNIRGERMRPHTFRKILQKLICRTGNATILQKKISIHNLRHSIATHLLEQGVPIEQVRQFLGHSQLETTEIYTRVSQTQLKSLLQ